MKFWRTEFTPEQVEFILNKIKAIRTQDSDGRVSFEGGSYDIWVTVLVSVIGLEFKSDAMRKRTVRAALSAPELGQSFTEGEFRAAIHRFRNKFQNEDVRKYRVVFPIWNLPSFLNGSKKIGSVSLNFSPSQKAKVFKTIKRSREIQQADRQFELFFTRDRLRLRTH